MLQMLISKIWVKFFESVVNGAMDWLSGNIVGIGGVPDKFLITDSKVSDPMSLVPDPNLQIELCQYLFSFLTNWSLSEII